MNPEYIHTGHELEENTNADTRKRVWRSSQECRPSLVIFRNVVRIVQ